MRTEPKSFQNRYGRQWGRGLRPYLLVPKLIFVGTTLGGVVSLLILVFARSAPTSPEAWRAEAEAISNAYRHVIVPGLLGAMFMGSLLAASHFRAFIRMRWFQAKLTWLVVCVPSLHFYMFYRSKALMATLGGSADPGRCEALRSQLLVGTLAALAFVLVAMWLGRIKPRLWQNYGRTFGKQMEVEGVSGG